MVVLIIIRMLEWHSLRKSAGVAGIMQEVFVSMQVYLKMQERLGLCKSTEVAWLMLNCDEMAKPVQSCEIDRVLQDRSSSSVVGRAAK